MRKAAINDDDDDNDDDEHVSSSLYEVLIFLQELPLYKAPPNPNSEVVPLA